MWLRLLLQNDVRGEPLDWHRLSEAEYDGFAREEGERAREKGRKMEEEVDRRRRRRRCCCFACLLAQPVSLVLLSVLTGSEARGGDIPPKLSDRRTPLD